MDVKNLGQLIQHLAKKAGIDAADQNLINVLANAELSKVTLHSDLVNALDGNLLSLEQAKDNHPEIGTVYKAQALNAIDKKVVEVATSAGLDEVKIAEITSNKNSYKKLELLLAAIQESAAASVTKPEDKSALQKQVDELLLKLQGADSETTTKLQAIEEKRKKDRIGYELRMMLSNVKTIYDDLPAGARAAALDAVIANALQGKNAVLDFDDKETFHIRQSDGANLVGAGHAKYTPQIFIDEVLAQNNILKVAEPTKKEGTEGSNSTVTTIKANPTAPTGNNQTASLNRMMREQAQKANAGS